MQEGKSRKGSGRVLRKLHRWIFRTVPNDGPLEIDLSRLPGVSGAVQALPELNLEWRTPEKPGEFREQVRA